MGMYGSRAVTLLVLISDDVINRILKLDIQTNILIYVTRCCTDLTSKVLKERTFGQSSALLYVAFHLGIYCLRKYSFRGFLNSKGNKNIKYCNINNKGPRPRKPELVTRKKNDGTEHTVQPCSLISALFFANWD